MYGVLACQMFVDCIDSWAKTFSRLLSKLKIFFGFSNTYRDLVEVVMEVVVGGASIHVSNRIGSQKNSLEFKVIPGFGFVKSKHLK